MLTKEEARNALAKLIEKYKSLTNKERQDFNEEQTKRSFIEPMFQILGWETSDHKEVVLESSDDPKAYQVRGLKSVFGEMLPFIPIMAETILLPFKGEIVHSGIINTQNVYMGGGMLASFKEELQKAKSKYGLITSLGGQPAEKKDSDESLLRFYCGTAANRERYIEEIEEILKNNPGLTKVYWKETSKSNSRHIRKSLRNLGVNKGIWFAVFGNTVVASGKSKAEVESRLAEILPNEKKEFVYSMKNTD